MDHARKIGKTKNPFPWKKSPSPPCSISDKPLIEDEELTEDRRLANWRKWIADRKRHYRSYGAATDRDFENLLMNTPEKFRRTVETRNLMERARSLQALSKRPGRASRDAGFWLTPEFLPKHGNPDLPDIPITLTKKQLNFAPEVERIALPELIQREKGLPIQKPPSNRGKYLNTQTELLSRELKSPEAKEPEIGKLAIRGQRLGRTITEAPKIPIVTIAGVEASESSKLSSKVEQESDIVMKIQDRILKFADKDTVDKDFGNFALVFRSTGSAAVERKIRFENRGTCTIIYRWRYGSRGSTLIPSTPRSSPFFFNKNKNLLLPGQVTVLRVWFRSHVPCSATEFWTLTTDPKICLAPLIFRFWGCCSFAPLNAYAAGLGADPGSIERYLDRRIRDTSINDIIGGILDDVGTTGLPSPAYKSLFVEGEIFRAKNPSYFYHPDVTRELRNIYDNATSKDSPAWDLSLDELRRVLLQLRKPRTRNEALLRFYELCRDCLVPSLCNPPGNSKISMVHNLLCSFANKFETESEHVRTKCSRGNNESRTRTDVRGDASSASSVPGASQVSLTRRGKSRKNSQSGKSVRTKSTSKVSVSTPTNRDTAPLLTSAGISLSECFFYKEVLYVRVRKMLEDTIGDICGIVDSFNNLSGPEK